MAPLKCGIRDILPDDPSYVLTAGGWGPPSGGGGAAWGAITGTLSAQTDLGSALSGKAAVGHDHAGVYSVPGHGHGPTDITGTAVVDNDSRLTDARTPTTHTHLESDVASLVTDLAGKAAASHGHPESEITSLVTDLAGKAASSHGHAPGDVTGTAVVTADSRLSDARTPTAHNHAGTDINSGSIDGDRLPALSTTKKGGVPATGTPSGKYLKDDGTWASPGGGGEEFKVGDIFISTLAENPAIRKGYGSWVSFGAGRVLVGLDSGDTDFDTPEEVGGSKTNTPSAHAGAAVGNHVFTQPSGHSNHVFTQPSQHGAEVTGQASAGATQRGTTASTLTLLAHTHATPALTHAGGAVDAHSAHAGGAVDAHAVTQPSAHAALPIVQPYIVVYMWKRTA